MGERAGYRLIAPEWSKEPVVAKKGLNALLDPPDGPLRTSPVYRMQWFLGDEPHELQHIMLALVNRLTGNGREKVGSGLGALRGDLKYDRLWPNFLVTLATLNDSPYNSLHDGVNCDISDHGLFTLRVIHWTNWLWEWSPVPWETPKAEEPPIPLLRATFSENKGILEGGLRFEEYRQGFRQAFGFEGRDTSGEA